MEIFLSASLNFWDHSQDSGESVQEAISLITFIAQLPPECLTEIELLSRVTFSALSRYFEKKQHNFNDEFLTILRSNLERNCIQLTDHELITYNIYTRDSFVFQIILLTSLKYSKNLLQQHNADKDNSCFLYSVVKLILQTIRVDKPQSLHLVKLLEMVLRKKEAVVSNEISMLVLKSMCKVATSPLTGFKKFAQDVSRIVLKSLPPNFKKHLCDVNNLPIKGIDLLDVLELMGRHEIFLLHEQIARKVIKLFHYNVESRDGSFFYEAVIKCCSFGEFQAKLWPFFHPYLKHFEEEGEFYNSLLKYWIPLNVKYYGSEFYFFLKETNVNILVKSYVLLETKKKGFRDSQIQAEMIRYLQYPESSLLELKMACIYTKKNIRCDFNDISSIKIFISCYPNSTFTQDILKSFRQFFSHIFLRIHVLLKKSALKDFYEELTDYIDLLTFVTVFIRSRIDSESCELAAQLLTIIWDVAEGSSSDLSTIYKIDRENVYEAKNNYFYKYLKTESIWQKEIEEPDLLNKMEIFLAKRLRHCPCLIHLVNERYLREINLEISENLHTICFEGNQIVTLQNLEKNKHYYELLAAKLSYQTPGCNMDFTLLRNEFEKCYQSLESHTLFRAVLILDVFLVVIKYVEIDIMPLLEKCLDHIYNTIEMDSLVGLNSKCSKTVEAFINNTIDCLLAMKSKWHQFQKAKMLRYFCRIIRQSNMKRPVSKSIHVMQEVGSAMEDNEVDREVKIRFLHNSLQSVYMTGFYQSKMRRNPETRLVIQALSLSDNNPVKPHLYWSLHFLIQVFSDPFLDDATISSTLNCLEVLVSDNSIHQFTLPYIPIILTTCVNLFNKKSWRIRNADLQLLKALIERLLGVSLDYCRRPKTVEDVFVLFPEVALLFYQTLSSHHLNDSAVIVLLFFSESQLKRNLLIEQKLETVLNNFKFLFANMIKSNQFGFLAIKSLTSLCIDSEIPVIFQEIVDYIKTNFKSMPRNVFANVVKLLKELHSKHKTSQSRSNTKLIYYAINDLSQYLNQFYSFYFNLLPLRLRPFDYVKQQTISLLGKNLNYENRILLNNQIPFLFSNVGNDLLYDLLCQISPTKFSDYLQYKVLLILAEKSESFVDSRITHLFILQLAELKDCNKFLITAYAKIILLFYEIRSELHVTSELIDAIRLDYGTKNIYKVMVYVLVLSQFSDKVKTDFAFLNNSVSNYISHLEDDEIVVQDLASTIVYLYRSSRREKRCNILKLAFYLSLQVETSFEFCKFVAFLTSTKFSNTLISLRKFLNFQNLLTCFEGDVKNTGLFLLECYSYAIKLPEEYQDPTTFYSSATEYSIPKLYIKRILRESLAQCLTYHSSSLPTFVS